MPAVPPRRIDGATYKTPGFNAPLRRGKWDLTEGGIRVPLIAIGPSIEADSQCNTPVIGYDLLPTFLDLVGSQTLLGDEFDGASLAPLLHDPAVKEVQRPLPNTLIFHFPHYNRFGLKAPHTAIRQGAYKLLYFHDRQQSLLFDVESDPGEKQDLCSAMPSRARNMTATLQAYLRQVKAEKPQDSITWGTGINRAGASNFVESFR